MKRADPRGSFGRLTYPVARASWEAGCISMFRRASYWVISAGVGKIAFYHRHPDWTGSIYELLVETAIERYVAFLKDRGAGDVVAEATNSSLDDDLRRLYRRLYSQGAQREPSDALRRLLTSSEMKIKPKHKNIVGLQMADLLASTCFNHMKRIYVDGPDFGPFAMRVADLIEDEKFLRCPQTGEPDGFGRIWRP